MKNITIDQLRELFDEIGAVCRKDGNSLFVPFFADENEDGFNQDFTVFFDVFDNSIRSWASISEYGTSLGLEKMNEFCNLWNDNKVGSRAYIGSDGDFYIDYLLWTDEDVSKEFVVENFIRFTFGSYHDFFVTLKQFIEGKDPFKEEESTEEDSDTDVEETDNSSDEESVEN